MAPQMQSELLSVKQFQGALVTIGIRVSRRTIQRWIDTGKLPCSATPCGLCFIDPREVDRIESGQYRKRLEVPSAS